MSKFGLFLEITNYTESMSREGALWIGGLESYMDEEFIQRCLQVMGEAAPISIKVCEHRIKESALVPA